MAEKSLDLASLFQAATQALGQNQSALNQADEYNHNHGDNMVETFRVITQAMEEKKNATPADQLEYASQLLRQKANSGSAQIYSQGLANAATQFQGKKVNATNALDLISTLVGAGQGQSANASQNPLGGMVGSLLSGMSGGESQQPETSQGDMVSSLLSGLTGGGETQQPQQTQGDLMGSLLAGLTGGGSQPSEPAQPNGLDAGDLLQAGMSFLQARQSGKTTTEALVGALLSNSALGGSTHRQQSGAIVANTLLQMIGSMTGK